MERLTVSSSPHIRHQDSSKGIMLDVIISLLPIAVAACIMYGWYSVLLVLVTVAAAVLSEYLCCKVMKRQNSIFDLSAAVTGLILALNLPPHLPLWMAAIGSVIAIVVVKMMFGGIGHNFANPAITARIALLVSFPKAMTDWVAPNGAEVITGATDATSMATPLTTDGYSYMQLFMGQVPGSLGETFKLLIILAFIYLVVRRVISPVIPVTIVGTVALMSVIFGLDPLYMILSGGLLFGAVFMATDYVTSPINWKGHIIFGVGIGVITFLIRRFGYLPEGMSYAILLMNLFVPYINRITAPKPFGWEAKK